MKRGKIDISDLDFPPEKHEFDTAKYFADLGKDVVFIKPSTIKGQHTPDIRMDGFEWEIKSPQGNSKRTIENNFRSAVMQSKYIIFDLRRIKLHDNQCVPKLEKEFRVRRYLKKLLIIKKDGTLLEIT
ncbi:MAG: hypothetical protein J6U54_25400 [Clostridiales bacterium]|nr:hypothetical protein [Clostridiales bacterium]